MQSGSQEHTCLDNITCSYSSSSAFPAISLGVHHSSSSAFPAISLGVHHSSSSAVPAISLGFTILLLLLLHSQLYLWDSPFFFSFFCIPSNISGVHHSSSSSGFPGISLVFTSLLLLLHSPAISLRFTIPLLLLFLLLLLLCSQLYLWSSPVFLFFVPSFISGVHHSSSSSAFPAI